MIYLIKSNGPILKTTTAEFFAPWKVVALAADIEVIVRELSLTRMQALSLEHVVHEMIKRVEVAEVRR